jgi:hypothetical protein
MNLQFTIYSFQVQIEYIVHKSFILIIIHIEIDDRESKSLIKYFKF